jgi:hypothetical protein
MTTSKRTGTGSVTADRRDSALQPNPSTTTLAEHVLLSTREAAALTTYTPHGLENLRSAGRGPAFIKMRGGAVAYRLRDLLAWQDSHRVTTLEQR